MKLKLSLTTQIVIGMVLGSITGILFGRQSMWLQFIGTGFLHLIQMAVGPLVLFSVVATVGRLANQHFERVGRQICLWFSLTTVGAAVVGVVAGLWFPARLIHGVHAVHATVPQQHLTSKLLLDWIPTNVFAALSQGNMVQITLFAILVGITIGKLNHRHEFDALLTGIDRVNQVLVGLIQRVLIIAPVGVFALVDSTVAQSGMAVLKPLLVFIGLFTVVSVAFMASLFVVCGLRVHQSPLLIWRRCLRIMVVAATTSSSAATLPVEMVDAKRLGIEKRIADLVLPLGMTLNSNGLAIYLALASISLAQLNGITITGGLIVKVIGLATLACLGTVVVPGGGLVALTIVLPGIGVPLSSIALLAGVDWVIGIVRTELNVLGDLTTAIMVSASTNQFAWPAEDDVD